MEGELDEASASYVRKTVLERSTELFFFLDLHAHNCFVIQWQFVHGIAKSVTHVSYWTFKPSKMAARHRNLHGDT